MADCDCRYKYANGENERVWLATENSNLRSDLRKAQQLIERLHTENDELRSDIVAFIDAVYFLLGDRKPSGDLADLLNSWEC